MRIWKINRNSWQKEPNTGKQPFVQKHFLTSLRCTTSSSFKKPTFLECSPIDDSQKLSMQATRAGTVSPINPFIKNLSGTSQLLAKHAKKKEKNIEPFEIADKSTENLTTQGSPIKTKLSSYFEEMLDAKESVIETPPNPFMSRFSKRLSTAPNHMTPRKTINPHTPHSILHQNHTVTHTLYPQRHTELLPSTNRKYMHRQVTSFSGKPSTHKSLPHQPMHKKTMTHLNPKYKLSLEEDSPYLTPHPPIREQKGREDKEGKYTQNKPHSRNCLAKSNSALGFHYEFNQKKRTKEQHQTELKQLQGNLKVNTNAVQMTRHFVSGLPGQWQREYYQCLINSKKVLQHKERVAEEKKHRLNEVANVIESIQAVKKELSKQNTKIGTAKLNRLKALQNMRSMQHIRKEVVDRQDKVTGILKKKLKFPRTTFSVATVETHANVDRNTIEEMNTITAEMNPKVLFQKNFQMIEDFKEKEKEDTRLKSKKNKGNFRKQVIACKSKLQALKLSPQELLNDDVFSRRPYDKKYSKEFLHAAKQGDKQMVKFYLHKNKNLVYAYDHLSQRGLHWAAKRNYCSIISLLIEHGADVNAQDGSNRTALYLASKQDNVEAVTLLLKNRADPFLYCLRGFDPATVSKDKKIQYFLTKAKQINVCMKFAAEYKRAEIWNNVKDSIFAFDENEDNSFSQ